MQSHMLKMAAAVDTAKLRTALIFKCSKPQPDADLPCRLLTIEVYFYNDDGSFYQTRAYGADQKDLLGTRIANWVLYGSLE